MNWRNIQFDWSPAAILLLAVLPLIWGFFFLYTYRKNRLEAFATTSVLDVVLQRRIPAVFWTKAALFSLAWICGVIALMQPKGNERYVISGGQPTHAETKSTGEQKAVMRQKMHTVIFLVDASASMGIADAYGGKSRLVVAKDIVDDVISKLRGESVALYAFTSAGMQIIPATMDYLFTRLMLHQIEINEGETEGTNILAALDVAKKRYFSLNEPTTKTVVLLTDGGDTSLYNLQGPQLKEAIDKIAKPLSDAEEKHVRLLAVGIGSTKGSAVPAINYNGKPVISSLEIPLLRRLSLAGRGELWQANEIHPMLVSEAISKMIARDTTYVDVATVSQIPEMGAGNRIYDLYYQIPLGLALLALACCFLIPDAERDRTKLKSVSEEMENAEA